MKIQSKIRAGKQNRKSSGAEAPEVEVVSVPVSRCVGV
jgi:hypothetical protein